MIPEGANRLLGHRVHGVRADQLLDVDHVAVGRVLGRGGGPERPLRPRALRCELLPGGAGEEPLVLGIGELRVGDGELAAEVAGAGSLEARIGLGVHARHEEAGDRRDPGEILAVGGEALQAVDVALGDLDVALEREDQRDVDRAAAGDRILDGGQAGERRRDLDEQVRPVDLLPEARHLGERLLGVVRVGRVNFQRDMAIGALRLIEDRAEHIAGVLDVRDGERDERLLRAGGTGQLGQLGVVGGALRERLLEDRRVGRDTGDGVLADQPRQLTAAHHVPRERVDPDALAIPGQLVQRAIAHFHSPPTARPASDGTRSARHHRT